MKHGNTEKINDLDIQAFIDDELGHRESVHIEECIRNDKDVARRYQQLRYQKELIKQWAAMKE